MRLTPLWKGDAECGDEVAEVFGHQVEVEDVVAGRDGRVGGEHGAGGHQFQGGGKVVPLFDELATALHDLEGRVAFVDVVHGRRQAQRAQGAHAADAEHDFLLDTGGLVAAVELEGDGAVGFRVLGRYGWSCRRRRAGR